MPTTIPVRTRPRTYLAGQLAAIGCPALLLSGEHDRLVPPGDVRAAAARIRHARSTLVARAGHWLPRDAPGQVIVFLAAVPRPRQYSQTAPDPGRCAPITWKPPAGHPMLGVGPNGCEVADAAGLLRSVQASDLRIPALPPAAMLPPSGHSRARRGEHPWTRTRLISTPHTKPRAKS